MSKQNLEAKAPTLEEVRHQFETWREARPCRQPIPDELLKAAVSLSQSYPTYKISRALRLNYTKLNNLIEDAKTSQPIIQDLAPAFIKLDLGASCAETCECLIEMKSCDGSEIKMHLKGDRYFDPLEICKAFWRKS